MKADSLPTGGHYLTLLALAFVWGSSFILMRIGLRGFDGDPVFNSYQVAALRMFLAGLFLMPIAIKRVRHISKRHLGWCLAVGVFGNLIPAFLFTSAQTELDSSVAGILNSLTPVFALILAMAVFKVRFHYLQLIGLGLGLLGAIGLISLKDGSGAFLFWPSAKVVLATMCYAVSLNVIRNMLVGVHPVSIAAISLGMISIPCGMMLLGMDIGEVFERSAEAGAAFSAILVLSVVGTALAVILFNRLVAGTSVIFASSVTYIIPIFAAMWGVFFDEHLQWMHLVYGLIILFGVYLINRKRPIVGKA